MKDYIDMAEKNGISLKERGACQFCGAGTTRGVHECIEIFNLGFQLINYTQIENHLYRFLSVDAHTLQHSEIHGRWNNHFHLTRQHLILNYKIIWNYDLSPILSNYLNEYKINRTNEFLKPPPILQRGKITTTDVLNNSKSEIECQRMIEKWALEVYQSWSDHHELVDTIATGFINKNKKHLRMIEQL
nr:DUF5946 family protein [uncultured Allomuricauda sp.]